MIENQNNCVETEFSKTTQNTHYLRTESGEAS